jgi:hypothetical protein
VKLARRLATRAWLWLDARELCPCLATSKFLRAVKLDDTDAGVDIICFMTQKVCGRVVGWHDEYVNWEEFGD